MEQKGNSKIYQPSVFSSNVHFSQLVSVFVSALEHHFVSQLSKVTPQTPEFVCCPFKPHIFRCPFFRDPVCISKSSFLWEAMGSSGTLHFDLFPIVRLLAQRLLALRLPHLFPHNLKNFDSSKKTVPKLNFSL